MDPDIYRRPLRAVKIQNDVHKTWTHFIFNTQCSARRRTFYQYFVLHKILLFILWLKLKKKNKHTFFTHLSLPGSAAVVVSPGAPGARVCKTSQLQLRTLGSASVERETKGMTLGSEVLYQEQVGLHSNRVYCLLCVGKDH